MVSLRLIFFILSLSLVGCLEAKKKPVDYGTENSFQDVSTALAKPLKDYTPLSMLVGEKVEWETYFFVRGSNEQRNPLGKYSNSITGRTETTDKIDFRLEFNVTKRNADGVFETKTEPKEYTVVKPFASMESLFSLPNLSLFSGRMFASANRISYHRLQVVEKAIDIPDSVKDKSVCSKWENCKMPVTHVHFEVVEWKPDSPEKTIFDYHLTPHLPFLTMLHSQEEELPANLETCMTRQLELEGKKYIVTFCTSLVDFAFGKTE